MSEAMAPMWSREAEQSVIGAILLDNGALDRVDGLRAEHFFDHAHRRIFSAASALISANKPADVITVYERTEAAGDDVGGLPYLNALSQSVPSASNISRYAGIVMDRARSRMLAAVGRSALDAAADESRPVDERIEQVSGEVMKLLEDGAQQESIRIGDLVAAHTEVIEARSNGDVKVIPTGLVDYDEMLGGGHEPGDLVIIGARPSMGKTALALTVATNMAAPRPEPTPVGFLSQEMSRGQLADRELALLGRISLRDVKRPPSQEPAAGAFWVRLVDATEAAAGLRLYVDDQGGLTIAQVRAKARAMRRKHGIKVLIVDYLQLMAGTDPKQNRAYQLEEITRGLKALAKELGILVIALAQVLRRVEAKADGMPGMSDLKDSGSIEQDADTILFVHRPIQTNPKLGDAWKFYAQCFLAKNRQGETGLFSLSYIPHETRFANWSGPAPEVLGSSRGRNDSAFG